MSFRDRFLLHLPRDIFLILPFLLFSLLSLSICASEVVDKAKFLVRFLLRIEQRDAISFYWGLRNFDGSSLKSRIY